MDQAVHYHTRVSLSHLVNQVVHYHTWFTIVMVNQVVYCHKWFSRVSLSYLMPDEPCAPRSHLVYHCFIVTPDEQGDLLSHLVYRRFIVTPSEPGVATCTSQLYREHV